MRMYRVNLGVRNRELFIDTDQSLNRFHNVERKTERGKTARMSPPLTNERVLNEHLHPKNSLTS